MSCGHSDGAGDDAYFTARSFRPTMPQTISARQRSRGAAVDSPKRIMPTRAVPIVPMPVQTAQAVPGGRLRMARARNPGQANMVTAVNKEGWSRVKPWEYFIPTARQTSNTPAMHSHIQFMKPLLRQRDHL